MKLIRNNEGFHHGSYLGCISIRFSTPPASLLGGYQVLSPHVLNGRPAPTPYSFARRLPVKSSRLLGQTSPSPRQDANASGSDPTRPRPPTPRPPAVAARQEPDHDAAEGDYPADDGLKDAADAADDCHYAVADGGEGGFDLE
ncbi:hypothetical protein E4U42_003252, partial [Claviceps africana]